MAEEETTAFDVDGLRKQQARDRQDLRLFKQPVRTLYYFGLSSGYGLARGTAYLARHPITTYLLLPAVLAYLGAKVTGYQVDTLYEVEEYLKYIIWWVGLGILSSIGLGTGMHSGLLFLFPHILKVCLTAETCGHTKFETRQDMWYNLEPFHCGDVEPGHIGFWELYGKVAITSMLWGAGTAIGEIPPYWLSYTAAVAGQKNFALAELEQHIQGSSHGNLIRRIISRMEQWMMQFIRTHGFFGILMLASWPNAAFDLCGLCCGSFKMPFWQFFGATLIGKGAIKVNGQTFFFISLFRKGTRDAILDWLERLLPARIPGLHLAATPAQELRQFINRSITKFQARVMDKSAAHRAEPRWFYHRVWDVMRSRRALQKWLYSLLPDTIAEVWGVVLVLLMSAFVISCINTFAQGYRAELDELEVEKQVKAAKKD